jgi:hypothetical protein
MTAANAGMKIDDQCLTAHSLNPLNRAWFACKHGAVQFWLDGRGSKTNGTSISKITLIGWEKPGVMMKSRHSRVKTSAREHGLGLSPNIEPVSQDGLRRGVGFAGGRVL